MVDLAYLAEKVTMNNITSLLISVMVELLLCLIADDCNFVSFKTHISLVNVIGEARNHWQFEWQIVFEHSVVENVFVTLNDDYRLFEWTIDLKLLINNSNLWNEYLQVHITRWLVARWARFLFSEIVTTIFNWNNSLPFDSRRKHNQIANQRQCHQNSVISLALLLWNSSDICFSTVCRIDLKRLTTFWLF